MANRNKNRQRTQRSSSPTVIQSIIVKPTARRPWDVGDWRQALQSADRGRVQRLYELYDDMLIDNVLGDAVDKRISAVLNADITFVNGKGETVDVISDIINTEEFELLQRQILTTRMWGRSATELAFDDSGLVVSELPAKHIDLGHKRIIYDLASEQAISYEGNDSLMVLGKERDYGIILRAIPFAIYKRGGFGDWSQWVELFGMPQRIGKYNAFDEASKRQLVEALENAGSASYVAIPKEADIEITATNSGSGTSFNEFRQACNEEMLIGILGQTLTTISGDKGARSLGEVHQDVEASKNKSDMRYVQRVLNRHFLPFLEARGLPVKGGAFAYPKDTEPITVNELVSLSGIIKIPASFVREKYGIPTATEGEELAGKAPAAVGEPAADKTEKDDKQESEEPKKEDDKPTKKRKKLFDLSDFFAYAPHPLGELKKWWRTLTHTTGKITLADDFSIDVRELLEQAIKEVYGGGVNPDEAILDSIFKANNEPLQKGISGAFSSTAGFGERNPEFIDEFRHNTAVFAAFKSHAQQQALVQALIDDDGNLRSFREFRRVALTICGKYNEQWLRTEYNMAVKSARSAVNYRDALRTKHLYPNLKYCLSSSRKKRPEHLEYVGTILPIGHKWWDTHMPPSAWGCNCSVEPTDEDPTEVPTEETVDPAFANNPGKTATPFKLSEHPYLKNQGVATCPECRKLGIIADINSADEEGGLCPRHQKAQSVKELEEKIAKRKKQYDKLRRDPNYKDVKFNPSNGGLKATHINHSPNKTEGGKGEFEVQNVGYNYGHCVILEAENHDVYKIKNGDGTWDGLKMEISTKKQGNDISIRNALKHCASKPNVRVAVINVMSGPIDLEGGLRRYNGLKGTQQWSEFDLIVVISDNKIAYYEK